MASETSKRITSMAAHFADGTQPSEKPSDTHTDASNGDANVKPLANSTSDAPKKQGPAGGYDQTPIPSAPPGYTVKITFHGARNLPMADIATFSSDPYVLAQLDTGLATRHKEDPPLRLRTRTVHRTTEPDWEQEWIVANVPATGFKLKMRVYDEDPANADDRLGNVHVNVDGINESWPGIHRQEYKIHKRMGSKRAYMIRMVAACINRSKHINGRLIISVEVLGRTEGDGGRAYTLGRLWWNRHFSPLLGRLTGTKGTDLEKNAFGRKVQRYNFQANQMQLQGPVPAELYHRYVEFRPFVKSMFTSSGIRGWVLGHALHHQHASIYNYDRATVYGEFDRPAPNMTRQFLNLCHYDHGGRIFTYVLTLDACLRFTETGKEFGIDMLSKHSMHSDVSAYVAFSGEFFIRRTRPASSRHRSRSSLHTNGHSTHRNRSTSNVPNAVSPTSPKSPEDDQHPPEDQDPAHYELLIDNDSGTYRPDATLLPLLRSFLQSNFPGLKITTLDCQADADRQQRLKAEQRERKHRDGTGLVFTQFHPSSSSLSSISSSDEEALDHVEKQGSPRRKTWLALAQGTVSAKDRKKAQRLQMKRREKERAATMTDEIPMEERQS